MHGSSAFLVDGIRTAIGSHCGSLSNVRADDLGAHVIAALMKRHPNIDFSKIGDVIFGCANQAGEDNRNVARMSSLLAGVPVSVPGQTVNRLCASGLAAAVDAARAIAVGDAELMLAGGVEHMTRAPWVMAKPAQAFSRNPEIYDTSIGWRFVNKAMQEKYGIDSMGQTAENVAEMLKISREAQDTFALASQKKAAAAQSAGRFDCEIAPIAVPAGKGQTNNFAKDEFIRVDSSIEGLTKLKPAFRTDGEGSVTAGNSSGINDGACALLFAREAACKNNNLKPMARIVSSAASGLEPRIMGLGPVLATQIALKRAGLSLEQIDIIELNEAFAAQGLGVLQQLGIAANDPRVNPNGGAIALGHPLGMSGARLLLTAAHELQLKNKRYALCTMCIGVGQGMAAIIERV